MAEHEQDDTKKKIEEIAARMRREIAWRHKFQLYRDLVQAWKMPTEQSADPVLTPTAARKLAQEAEIAWEAFIELQGPPQGGVL